MSDGPGSCLSQKTRGSTGTSSGLTPFDRLQRCYERNQDGMDAFFDLADTIITVRSLIRQAWTLHRQMHPPTPGRN